MHFLHYTLYMKHLPISILIEWMNSMNMYVSQEPCIFSIEFLVNAYYEAPSGSVG